MSTVKIVGRVLMVVGAVVTAVAVILLAVFALKVPGLVTFFIGALLFGYGFIIVRVTDPHFPTDLDAVDGGAAPADSRS